MTGGQSLLACDDGPRMGDEIIGRRAEDGNSISFREAVKMFATKEEVAAMGVNVEHVAKRVDNMMTRDELSFRFGRDDEFRKETKETLDTLKAARVPTWVLSFLTPIVTALVVWLLTGGHH